MVAGTGDGNSSTSMFLIKSGHLETHDRPANKHKQRCAMAMYLIVLGHFLYNEMAC